MQLTLGINEYLFRTSGKTVPISYNTNDLINGHMLLCGMSGTGKSHQSRRLLAAAGAQGISIDIFDVHDELGIPGSCSAKYSQATKYGYNPLILNLDLDTGGVNRQADFIVALVKQVTPQFGVKQESALRNLIIDLYASRGIFADNPKSWARSSINEAERKALRSAQDWTKLRETYPTLTDLIDYAERKVLAIRFGADNKAMAALQRLSETNAKLLQAQTKLSNPQLSLADKAALTARIDKFKGDCIETYTEAVQNNPARELKDILKYDSRDVLVSVLQRLQLLNSTGIFDANEPPLAGKVRVHQIKSLTRDQQILFVKLRLSQIFDAAKSQPATAGNHVRHIAFLDEAPQYFSPDPDDIINIISREARKFGVALWCAAQEPTVFPQGFLTNCGTKLLLGIDPTFWKKTITTMRITEDQLRYIKAQEVIACKLHKQGQPDSSFINVVVPNSRTPQGRAAEAIEQRQAQGA